jgi:uncharacterized protein (TIGR03435 family)
MFGRMLSCIALMFGLGTALVVAQERPAQAVNSAAGGSAAVAARQMRFDVISIRPAKPGENVHFGFGPDGFSAVTTLNNVICLAYFAMNMSDRNPISGAPDWATKEQWSIEAKIAPEDVAYYQQHRPRLNDPPEALGHQLLQSLLADRFHMVAHQVPAQMDGYALVVARGGPKLKQAAADDAAPERGMPVAGGGWMSSYGGEYPHMQFYGVSMSGFAAHLFVLGCAAVDRTGLTGRYDFTLNWLSSGPDEQHVGDVDSDDPDKLSHWDLGALGLRAERVKLPTEHVVIDHVELPAED